MGDWKMWDVAFINPKNLNCSADDLSNFQLLKSRSICLFSLNFFITIGVIAPLFDSSLNQQDLQVYQQISIFPKHINSKLNSVWSELLSI